MHNDVLVKVPLLAPNTDRPQAAPGDAASLGQRLHGTLWASELAGAMTGATASKCSRTSKLARDLDKIEHIHRRGTAANGAKDLRHRHTMLHVGVAGIAGIRMPRREAGASDSTAKAIEPAPVARSDLATRPATGLHPPGTPAPCADRKRRIDNDRFGL